MKIVFKGLQGNSALGSQGIKFVKGVEYDVTAEVGEYVLKTFGDAFVVVDAPKPKKVEEPVAKKAEEPVVKKDK